MKKYLFSILILSIIGHGLFFGVFKADIKDQLSKSKPQLYLISNEQFNYIKSITGGVKDIIMSPFPESLFSKNNMWGDTINIVEDVNIMGLDIETRGDTELLSEEKGYDFEEIYIPSGSFEYIPEKIIPMFGDIFYAKGLAEKIHNVGEHNIGLNNNISLVYYIQGPCFSRELNLENMRNVRFNIDKTGINIKLRFWVTKDGRINQVIIEEGSSFPLIDSEIVNLVKSWHFNPLYGKGSPNYEWGILHIRLVK